MQKGFKKKYISNNVSFNIHLLVNFLSNANLFLPFDYTLIKYYWSTNDIDINNIISVLGNVGAFSDAA